jgi:hypothetical protein
MAWRTVLPGDVRDIVIARSTDRGETWSEAVRPHADDWVFPGCPHAGPSLHVGDDGTVHIAWWTGKEGAAGAYYARSTAGSQFTAPVPLGIADFSRPAHVQMAVRGQTVVVTWDDGTIEVPRVVARTSSDGGSTFGPATLLSPDGRAAGYPVVAFSGDRVVIAWSEDDPAQDAEHAHGAEAKDPAAPKGLSPVGRAQVIVRRGRM